ncbi:galactose-3-O-sulfotransferase 3-like isoform X1 [Branchiostoma floridae x Branchiostoma belcheri]
MSTEMSTSKWSGILIVVGACMGISVTLYMNNIKHQSEFSTYRAVSNTSACRPCQEHTNFVFVKVHKAGGSTVAAILQRFGDVRNLSFVLPRRGIRLGWPNQLKRRDFLPTLTGEYNILVRHVVYNKKILQGIMPNDTVYITILREPFSHFKSAFNFFHVARHLKIKGKNPVLKFLKSPGKYRSLRETKNFMSFDLGFPVKRQSNNQDAIRKYVAKIDEDFLLVMILEYLNESLVLLKRYMCWSFTDILYWKQNKRTYKYKEMQPSLEQRRAHQSWSKVDYAMYAHFNATLWKKIELQGPDFWEEVRRFQAVQGDVMEVCQSPQGVVNTRINASKWSDEVYVDADLCSKIKRTTLPYFNFLKNKYNLQRRKVSAARGSFKRQSHCFQGTTGV